MILETYLSFKETQTALAAGNTSCKILVKQYLNRIAAHQHLNIFLEVFEADALKQAAEIDEKLKAGNAGKLAGMVVAIKDNICYKNHAVSASSKILDGFVSPYSATVIERLLKADAIIIGRCNCDEFAMGGSNENSAYGNVLNPIDITRVPGGSSGGSAAAVAANLCLAALGTDTGGSIRQPAAFCGVIGLKPTYGRVSRYGIVAYASSFDQVGPITRTVEDSALLLEVIAGADEFDSTISSKPVAAYTAAINAPAKKYKIAYLDDCINNKGLDPEIKTSIQSFINELKSDNHTVEPVAFPLLDYVVPAYYVLTTAEASSNLSRYDGMRFGYRSKAAQGIDDTYKKSRTEGFGLEVKRRIMLGTFVLSAGYYDAYYAKAQKVRRLILDKTKEILSSYDFILLPTTPGIAFKIGEKNADPIKMYLEDIFTVHANLTGMPAISLPIGKHSNGMPFGLQLIANKFEEQELLAFSQQVFKKHVLSPVAL